MKSGMDKKNEVDWWKLIRNDELATALDIFPNEKNLEVLEIGGRDGFQAELISKKGYKITSIDINPLSPQFHLVQKGDVTKLNFNEGSFDIIFSSNMIQEIENIEDAFAEMNRVLKKDGAIIFMEPLGTNPLINIYRKLTPNDRSPDEHPLKSEDIKLINSIFKNVEIKYYGFLTLVFFPFYKSPKNSRLFKIISSIDEMILKIKYFLY